MERGVRLELWLFVLSYTDQGNKVENQIFPNEQKTAKDRWEETRMILAWTSPTASAHWENSKTGIDPPYWTDFLHSTDSLKRALQQILAQNMPPPHAKHSVFMLADRLMGRSRFVSSREWYLASGRYIIKAAEFDALQKLMLFTFRPSQFPSLMRVDIDRAVHFSAPACSFPLYISDTVANHHRFVTRRERALYPCPFLAYPRPNQDYYQEQRAVTPWILPDGAIGVCEGLHLSVTVESPGARAISIMNSGGRAPNYRSLLRVRHPFATEDEVRRYAQKAQRMELVAFVSKNMGCFDTEYPFAQSANVVMVDDAEMIEHMLAVSDTLNLGLRTDNVEHLGRSAVFPFSFPPALCDEERVLQETLLETGTAFATPAAAEDFVAHTLRQHGMSFRSLADVPDNDFHQSLRLERPDEDDVLKAARQLVGEALQKLRHVEAMSRWISDDILGKELLDRVWQDLKLKKEWQEISNRWKYAPEPRKSKNKKTRKQES